MQQQIVHMIPAQASTRCYQIPKLKEQRGQLPKHFVLRPLGKHHPAKNNLLEWMLLALLNARNAHHTKTSVLTHRKGIQAIPLALASYQTSSSTSRWSGASVQSGCSPPQEVVKKSS